MTGELLVADHGPVRVLTLNRPARRNALTRALLAELRDAVIDADSDGTRAVVVAGAANTFSSGVDLDGPNLLDGPPLPEVLHGIAATLRAVDVPIVAAVSGYAYGAGLALALGCDIRIAAPSAQLCEAYIRIGRYSGGGDTVLLPRLVGSGRALRLLWTGQAISGSDAFAIGLVDELADDPLARAMELAATISERPPAAIRLTKRAVHDLRALPFDEALARSIALAVSQGSEPSP